LNTTTGKYVLKRYLYHNRVQKLQLILTLLSYLKSQNFPVNYTISTKNNKLFCELEGGLYTLHRFIDGTTYKKTSQLNREQFVDAIKTLVRYHTVVWNLNLEGETIESSVLPVVYTENTQWLRSYINKHRDIFTSSIDYQFIMRQIDKMEFFLSENSYNSLPRIIIHGDYRAANLVFKDNQVVGVLDWDLVQYAPRLVDVCGKLAENSIKNIKMNSKLDEFIDFLLIYQSFAYKNGVELSTNEITTIPEIFRATLFQMGINLALFLKDKQSRTVEKYELGEDIEQKRFNKALRLLHILDNSNWHFLYEKIMSKTFI
jgi:aminoglycoside phosphotransferase (APT) family kinase protein